MWLAFCRCWLRVFGAREILVVIEGKEFMDAHADRAVEDCLAFVFDARAPRRRLSERGAALRLSVRGRAIGGGPRR
eukprot:1053441-Pyramimonas_sp.AAC.1